MTCVGQFQLEREELSKENAGAAATASDVYSGLGSHTENHEDHNIPGPIIQAHWGIS